MYRACVSSSLREVAAFCTLRGIGLKGASLDLGFVIANPMLVRTINRIAYGEDLRKVESWHLLSALEIDLIKSLDKIICVAYNIRTRESAARYGCKILSARESCNRAIRIIR